jgi:predicted ATPase
MSLGRLWQQQGKSREAHDLLAPVYEWFTEGLDTADLQEARALKSSHDAGSRQESATMKPLSALNLAAPRQ